MSELVTGLLTLTGAFGSIWLKDYLECKKSVASTRRQKAVEAYALAGNLMNACSMLTVVCSNLARDKQYPYLNVHKDNPYDGRDGLEQLELLIVENFSDITTRAKLLAVENSLITFSGYLLNIITTIQDKDFQLDSSTFKKKNEEFEQGLVQSCHDLRSHLFDEYIDKPTPAVTFFTLLESGTRRIKLFFTK